MKRSTIAMSIAGIGAATLLGVSGVQAAQDVSRTSLVDKIASQFNLDKADVQKVFDADRSEMEAKRATEQADRLQKAVDAGTITSAQKDLIIAKQAELKTQIESLKDKTAAERRTAMKSKMDEIKQWATDNSIPQDLFRPGGGHGPGGHGGGRPDGFGPDEAPPTSTQ